MFLGRWSSTQCSAYDAASAARPQIVQEAPGAKNQKLPVQPVRRLGSQWQSFRWRSDGDSLRLARGFAFAQVECPKNRSLKDYLIWKFAFQGPIAPLFATSPRYSYSIYQESWFFLALLAGLEIRPGFDPPCTFAWVTLGQFKTCSKKEARGWVCAQVLHLHLLSFHVFSCPFLLFKLKVSPTPKTARVLLIKPLIEESLQIKPQPHRSPTKWSIKG